MTVARKCGCDKQLEGLLGGRWVARPPTRPHEDWNSLLVDHNQKWNWSLFLRGRAKMAAPGLRLSCTSNRVVFHLLWGVTTPTAAGIRLQKKRFSSFGLKIRRHFPVALTDLSLSLRNGRQWPVRFPIEFSLFRRLLIGWFPGWEYSPVKFRCVF